MVAYRLPFYGVAVAGMGVSVMVADCATIMVADCATIMVAVATITGTGVGVAV